VRTVHDQYFCPQHEEFAPRTLWNFSNAFTSAFKELDAVPHVPRHGLPGRIPGKGNSLGNSS
jgi:hypothetical protein